MEIALGVLWAAISDLPHVHCNNAQNNHVLVLSRPSIIHTECRGRSVIGDHPTTLTAELGDNHRGLRFMTKFQEPTTPISKMRWTPPGNQNLSIFQNNDSMSDVNSVFLPNGVGSVGV
jgi:hypothetical protein